MVDHSCRFFNFGFTCGLCRFGGVVVEFVLQLVGKFDLFLAKMMVCVDLLHSPI